MKKIFHPVSTTEMAGFEPTSAAVKVLCLTTWRHPCTRVANWSLATAPMRIFCYVPETAT